MLLKSAAGYLLLAAAFVRRAEAKLGRKPPTNGIFGEPVTTGNGSPSGVGEPELDAVFPTVVLDETATDGEPETAELLYTPDDKYVDKICVDYCDAYFYTYCQHHNIFVNRRRRLQKAGERNPEVESQRTRERLLVETEEVGSNRGKDYSKAMQDCHKTCMIWPRPLDPMEFWNSVGRENYINTFDALTSNLGGDTFWCRERHMTMTAIFEKAEYNGIGDNFQGGFQSSAAFHCSLANPDGAGICTDSTIGRTGMSPYELQRSKQQSRVHIGYCDVIDNGKIVDCTGQNTIADSNLDVVLSTFPDNMEVLFLNGIEGITHLESDIFQENLKRPDRLKALYINQCNIMGALNEVGESPFRGLVNLEVLNLDENRGLNVVNSGLLDGLTKLKQYAMFDSSIELLPPDMFDDCKKTLEVMTIYCLPGPQDKLGTHGFFDANFFRGMDKLVTMSFVFCDFDTDDVVDDSMFDDLKSLKWWDFNGDAGMKSLKNRWFNCDNCGGSKMGEGLVRFAMWGTGLEDCVFDDSYDCINANTVPGEGDKVFQNLNKLEAAWFYNTYLTVIPELYLDDKDHFEAITIGTPITGQLPN